MKLSKAQIKAFLLNNHLLPYFILPNMISQLVLGSWGVPLGIQVVAGRNQDRNCLAVASELERLFGGWVAPS